MLAGPRKPCLAVAAAAAHFEVRSWPRNYDGDSGGRGGVGTATAVDATPSFGRRDREITVDAVVTLAARSVAGG